jgi:hypothetical protein
MRAWRNCQVLSEQTSDSSAFLVMCLLKCVNSIFIFRSGLIVTGLARVYYNLIIFRTSNLSSFVRSICPSHLSALFSGFLLTSDFNIQYSRGVLFFTSTCCYLKTSSYVMNFSRSYFTPQVFGHSLHFASINPTFLIVLWNTFVIYFIPQVYT